MLSREFACKSEGRLQRISKWRRDQASTLLPFERRELLTFMRRSPSRASRSYTAHTSKTASFLWFSFIPSDVFGQRAERRLRATRGTTMQQQ